MRKVVAALAFATGLALFSSPAHGQPAQSATEESRSQTVARQDTTIVVAREDAATELTPGGEALGVTRSEMLAATRDVAFTTSHLAPGLIAGVGLIVTGGLLLLAVRRRTSTA